ncbi:MAG: hypothetical protein HY558_01390 [Euryarchaeota archaeon]|nr:hypothetical protein [Euryarchaeota archaeon]
MLELDSRVRKWGSSAGILIPKGLLEAGLQVGEEVRVRIYKKVDLERLRRHRVRFTPLQLQRMKDSARKGWQKR